MTDSERAFVTELSKSLNSDDLEMRQTLLDDSKRPVVLRVAFLRPFAARRLRPEVFLRRAFFAGRRLALRAFFFFAMGISPTIWFTIIKELR